MQLDLGDEARFLPYELRGPLGSGGMGEVYRAWDPRLQREVALKVLRERGAADPERVRRFVSEARAASALNHPNILTVFDAAVDAPTPYIVAELIDGHSLRDELRRGPVPAKRLLDIATQIADGLSEAHAVGIVHRDLKPENIMITRAGRAKIVDFGLAAAVAPAAGVGSGVLSTETLTEPSLLVGTVPYMSPEQARGTAGDFQSDQFALGLILYEMATGQAAFRRDSPAATLDAIIHDEPAPLTARAPRVPFVLSWIVERCLAKNPADRYGVTSDLHRDLRTLRDRLGDTTTAAGADGGVRTKVLPWAVAVVLMTIAAVAGAVLAWRANSALPPVDLTELRFRALATGTPYEGLPAFSPDGETVAYAQDVDGVLEIFTRRLSVDTASAAQVTTAAFDCKYPFWSPDGKRLYYISQARKRAGLWSIGAAGGSPEVVVENVTRAAISPDGRTLAFLRDEQRADTIGTAALWLATPEGSAPWSNAAVEKVAKSYAPFGGARFIDAALAFSPDGTHLALCGVPGIREDRMWQFWLIPLQAGEPRRRLQSWSDAGPKNIGFAWFPDGRHVALGMSSLATPGSHLWIADLETDWAWPVTRGADSEYYPSVAASGDRIVFTRGEPDFDLVSISLGQHASPQPLLTTPQSESDPAFRPDGSVFAYVTDRTGQDEIWARSLDGSVDKPLVTQRDFGDDRSVMLSSPVFSPDGRRVAYQRNGVTPRWPLRIWISMPDGGSTAPLLPANYEGIQGAPTWSQDGQFIAFAQWREQAWELATVRYGSGEGPRVLRNDGVANAAPHWSPPGTPEWITWETADGLVLVSPDGKREQRITSEQWLVHTWSADGTSIIGIKETDDSRLALVAVTVSTGKERTIAEVGRSSAFNNPVKGLTLLPGGRAVATSLVRPRGDLWLAEGIRWRHPAAFPGKKP